MTTEIDVDADLITVSLTVTSVSATAANTQIAVDVDDDTIDVTASNDQAVVTCESSESVVVAADPVISVVVAAEQGPAGVDGSGALTYSFEFSNATPKSLNIATAGKSVLRVEICITEAFDGTGAALSIGDSGNYSRLMATSENDPLQVVTFGNTPGISYLADTQLYLSITPGSGATAGEGVVSIVMEQ